MARWQKHGIVMEARCPSPLELQDQTIRVAAPALNWAFETKTTAPTCPTSVDRAPNQQSIRCAAASLDKTKGNPQKTWRPPMTLCPFRRHACFAQRDAKSSSGICETALYACLSLLLSPLSMRCFYSYPLFSPGYMVQSL
jgi:hypothetical protein